MRQTTDDTTKSAAPPCGRLEAYYTQPAIWDMERYEGNADQRLRARVVAAMVDPQADTVLDLGCGNGFLTRRLRAKHLVVGLDPSQEALKWVQGPRVLGTGGRLPFADRAFDTIVCCEVLEHLPEGVFRATVNEMARVARTTIIVGVPYRQDLRPGMTRCAACGCVYHVDLHCRSFAGPEAVAGLFPGFGVEAVALPGPCPSHCVAPVPVAAACAAGAGRGVGLQPMPRLRLGRDTDVPRRERQTPSPPALRRPRVAHAERKKRRTG